MKRYIVFIILSSCMFYNGLAQSKSQKSNSPKEDIKVNREYDEQGNLIRFDSTYTYNWSGDTTFTYGNIPENFDHFFDDQFRLFNDSSIWDKSLFNDFNHFFQEPFDCKRDSVFFKKFGFDNFNFFDFKNDSLSGNMKKNDDLFGRFKRENPDSIGSRPDKNLFDAQRNSMDEMIRMMQKKMKEMEEFHKQLDMRRPD